MAKPLPPAEDSEDEPPRLLEDLGRLTGQACGGCGRGLCGHGALFSVALGYKDRPRCPDCLARLLDWAPGELREHLLGHVQARECFRKAWAVAGEREGFGPAARPPCTWPDGVVASPGPARGAREETDGEPGEAPTLVWDAGDMGCGELVLALRLRLREVPAGALLAVTARDPAAPEDLPAWCRLTGHRLVRAAHPEYVIRRKGPTKESAKESADAG